MQESKRINEDNQLIFLIHQSYQHRGRLPECISYISNKYKELKVGTIIRLPRLHPKKVKEYVEKCCDYTDLIIVDPEVYTHKDDMNLAKAKSSFYSYMTDDLPNRKDVNWIKKVISKQREFGGTVLLTPSIFLNTARPERNLRFQLEIAEEAMNIINGNEEVMVNLTLDQSWISDNKNRAILLNELIDADFINFYIRVYWPPMIPRYGQLRDKNILEGYRELCTYMNLEGKNLILPTTNLTGWICTALGAKGFSTGPSKEQQSFSEELKIRKLPDVPSPQRKERYFERALLHVVDIHTHDLLLAETPYSCQCLYCQELEANNSNRSSPWDHEAASLHQIVQAAELTSLLVSKNPRGKALREVKKAIHFFESLETTIKPRGENKPNHLEIWETILK